MDELALLPFAAVFFLLGIASGIVSGLFGVGGGVLRIPVFVLVFPAFGIHSDIEMRVGAGGGVWTGLGIADRPSWSFGYVDGLVFLLMLPGVLFATGPGVALGSRLKPERLRKCYAGFLTLIAVSIVIHLMGSRSGIT